MSTILAFGGIVATVLIFFASSVLFFSLKEGDRSMSLKSGGVVAACLIIILVGMAGAGKRTSLSSSCYVDWDARSNSTVCD